MNDQSNNTSKLTFCVPSFLYNNIQSGKDRTIVFDTRDTINHANNILKHSVSLSTQRVQSHLIANPQIPDASYLSASDLNSMLAVDESKKFAKRRRCFCFLIISENGLTRNFVHEVRRLANVDDHEDYFNINQDDMQELLYRTLEESQERESIRNGLEIFKTLKKDKVRELFILMEGATSFFEKSPYMNTVRRPEPMAVELSSGRCFSVYDNDLPHDILDGRLFLGSFNQSEKYELVSNLKITHILNITFECCNCHEDKGVKYLKISILDEPDKNIHEFFRQAYDFINEALSEDSNNKVLIHCALGKSRSATITIMYLMKKFSWSFEKAFDFVKRKREIIEPNDGFIQRLQEFEKNQLVFLA
jgi:dual specificity MAP kinase phosphatase